MRVRVRQSWTCLSQPSGHHACPLTHSFIQLTTELGKCQHYEIIALKMQELCLNFQKKKFWQGGNPPFNPQKRQKSLRAFFSLGKEIKLKIQGGGKFFKLEERIYTPVIFTRVAPDIRPFLVSGRISGFVCRISGEKNCFELKTEDK